MRKGTCLKGKLTRFRFILTHNGVPDDFDPFPSRHDIHRPEDPQHAHVLNHLENDTEIAASTSFLDEIFQAYTDHGLNS